MNSQLVDGMGLARRAADSALVVRLRRWLVLATAGCLAWGAGLAIARGGRVATLIVLGGVGAGAVSFVAYRFRDYLHNAWAVEVPIFLLLISTQVFRLRTTGDLAANPVDSAGAFRVACVAAAALLGLCALLAPRAESLKARTTTTPFRIFAGYVFVVFLGAPLSVDPLLTAYRGIELAAGIIVFAGVWNIAGDDAGRRVGAVLFWFVTALVASVWLGLLLFPNQALKHYLDLSIPIGVSLAGALPLLSSNDVGLLGVLLTVWSLARATSPDPVHHLRPGIAYPLAVVGVVTLVAAQYRTGYIAFVVAMAALLVLRRKWLLLGSMTIAIAAVLISIPSLVPAAQPYALRGTNVHLLTTLDSRVVWWSHALQVWEESPIIGRGLLTASRFEVLEPLGLDVTSTIHSTWVEALVGTGLLGLFLVATAFCLTFGRALMLAIRDRRDLVPLLLLLVLFVRTFTGSTFEIFQGFTLLVLWLMLLLDKQDVEHVAPRYPASDRLEATLPGR
jgi:O-antigen ligase